MLTIYDYRAGELRAQEGKPKITEQTVWIDLLNPTSEEEDQVERSLNLDVPTREEQQEIEASSRLYQENGAHFMTATLLYLSDQYEAKTTAVTFILVGPRLVTVRYAEPRAFAIFASRCNRSETDLGSGAAVLVGLIETIIDRLADFIERIQSEVDQLSHSIFEIKGGVASRQHRFDVMLRSIGREGEVASRARESAHSLGRLLTFLAHAANERKEGKPLQARIRTAARDVTSLTDHATFLSSKIIFLLDATLGMINIQQNDIIKIFSVAAVVFLPPTLIASIYGMNFHHMPELNWLFGYPFAIVLMVMFAVLPYVYFKRKGWL
jgi:magnesium transporter